MRANEAKNRPPLCSGVTPRMYQLYASYHPAQDHDLAVGQRSNKHAGASR